MPPKKDKKNEVKADNEKVQERKQAEVVEEVEDPGVEAPVEDGDSSGEDEMENIPPRSSDKSPKIVSINDIPQNLGRSHSPAMQAMEARLKANDEKMDKFMDMFAKMMPVLPAVQQAVQASSASAIPISVRPAVRSVGNARMEGESEAELRARIAELEAQVKKNVKPCTCSSGAACMTSSNCACASHSKRNVPCTSKCGCMATGNGCFNPNTRAEFIRLGAINLPRGGLLYSDLPNPPPHQ